MRAIANIDGRLPQIPYDLKKIKALEILHRAKMPSYDTISFFRFKEHDFSVLEEMENLHTLIFNTRKPLTIADFSFLEKCKKLKKLDLSQTNFTDCALLTHLSMLTYVRLPEKSRLVNTQVLDMLCAKIDFDEIEIYDYPIEQIASLIKEQTKMPAYALTLRKGVKPDLFDSKFGGLPYWNPKMPYPVDKTGQKMMLIAQINFDKTTVDERLPQQGMLQFFIALDDDEYLYGYDDNAPDSQEMFRVVYHETVDYSVTKEQVLELDIPLSTNLDLREYNPIKKEIGVDIVPREVSMDIFDRRFNQLFRDAEISLTGKDIGNRNIQYLLKKEDLYYLHDELSYCSHHMLGYPLCNCYNFKVGSKNEAYYDTVLLQIHSEIMEDADRVLWSDSGVIQFFINSEALERRDFRKVFYRWSCISQTVIRRGISFCRYLYLWLSYL